MGVFEDDVKIIGVAATDFEQTALKLSLGTQKNWNDREEILITDISRYCSGYWFII